MVVRAVVDLQMPRRSNVTVTRTPGGASGPVCMTCRHANSEEVAPCLILFELVHPFNPSIHSNSRSDLENIRKITLIHSYVKQKRANSSVNHSPYSPEGVKSLLHCEQQCYHMLFHKLLPIL